MDPEAFYDYESDDIRYGIPLTWQCYLGMKDDPEYWVYYDEDDMCILDARYEDILP